MAEMPNTSNAILASAGPNTGGSANAPDFPSASPMTTPQAPEGLREAAKVDVMLATKVLERALPAFGFDSKEGKAILNALRTFGNVFGESKSNTQELMPAELQQLMQSIPQGMGGGPAGAGSPGAAPSGPTPPTASPSPPGGMPPGGAPPQ